MCQPTGWDAQPHGWGSDEAPADRLEVRAGRLEALSGPVLFSFDTRLARGVLRSSPNPLISSFAKRNKHGTIEYHLQQVKNTNLKWRVLPSAERHAYCERLSKLQVKGFRIPRVPSWTLFYNYNIEETLKNKMNYEYLHDDGDVFVDYSWERALLIYGDVYPEWCLEFFSTMYFDRGVDRTKLMMKKCIWFKLCGVEKVLTLLEFVVLLGLYEEDELSHRVWVLVSKEDGFKIPGSGYEIGGSSAGFHGDDFDPIVHSENCVDCDDDEMQD
ncbi:hypothetical protein Tco_0974242 [Tanacetum coccineum]|uniref:Uncharacterized protein n=1 Tax=Tanacetum coccineum TaxID=301880 RepID=A0ABQ5EB11_9ASTR